MPDQLYLNPLFRSLRTRWIALALFALFPSSAHAAFEFQPIGAHTSGTGDAGVALAAGAAGAFWNPAALALGQAIGLFGNLWTAASLNKPNWQHNAFKRWPVGLDVTAWAREYTDFGFSLHRKEQVFGLVYGLRAFNN